MAINRQHIRLVFLFLFLPALLVAQPPFQNPITLNQKNGLPSNSVWDIVQDHNGFIWIATSKGLCRFDGHQMKVYDFVVNDTSNLYTRAVEDIMVDQTTGHLWLSTSLGLHVYNPVLDTFKSYLPVPGDATQLANTQVSYTYQDRQGQVWVSSFTDGLALYRPTTDDFQQIYPSHFFGIDSDNEAAHYNQVNCFIQDYQEDHIYWFIVKRGLVRWDRSIGNMTVVALPDDGTIELEKLIAARTMYQHSDGTIFMGLWANGFITWHPKTKQWRKYETVVDNGETIDIRTIYSILPKDKTCVYIANNWNQLFVYDLQKKAIVQTLKGSRRSQEQYTLQLIDKDGNLWAGLQRGISIYSPMAQHMRHFPLPITGDDPEWLYRPDGVLYEPETGDLLCIYSYAKGVYRLDLETQTFTPLFRMEDQKKLEYLHGILRTGDGKIWLLHPDDLFEFSPKTGSVRKVRPTEAWRGASFIQFYRDSRNDVWIGSYNHGLFRYDFQNKQWHNYKEAIETPTEDRHSIWLWGFTEDHEGKLWFRTGTGYSIYYPEKEAFENFPYIKGEKNNYQGINAFCLDQSGRLWVSGGREGLGLIDPTRPEKGIYQHFGVAEGMTLDSPQNMLGDQNGDIWLVDGERLGRYKSKMQQFEYFDEYYGVPAYDDLLDMEPLSSCDLELLPDGRVVVQYRRGVALFHPDSLKRNSHLPTPYLSSFQVKNQPHPLDSSITIKKRIMLKAWENDFSFEFSAINFTVPEQTRFRYRLLGDEEEEWIEAGERRYAAFTNVPGGDYTLQLMAANSDGLWNDTLYELAIHLSTPWYQTVLFQVGLLLFVGGVIWLIYRVRVNQIRKKQAQKAAFERKLANVEMNALRAQMNPHFIFNCLNSIDSFIIRNQTHKASEYLNDFARLIRLILQNSRTNFINLKDELEALGLYLQMEQLRFREKFAYEINVDEGVNQPATLIPPMLIQPYVENAIWHGLLHKRGEEKGKVIVDIRLESKCLVISITDNGIGRKKAAEIKARKTTNSRKSMGIQITGDRIAMINQLYDTTASANTVDLVDGQGNACGTKVVIRIPV